MIRKFIITAVAVLIFVAAFFLRETQRQELGQGVDQTVTEVGELVLPRLVDLGSDKCIPCKEMAPMLEELRDEYATSFKVEFIDVWKNPDAGQPYGVRVIPTQVFLDAAGEERFRHEGFLGKEAILAKWKELGLDLAPRANAAGS